ncbi:guanylate kinase [Candidatus Berkelbacteria bacterium]|nr:guanylate kinase [Candidatus Berkelbacteria bacterium]
MHPVPILIIGPSGVGKNAVIDRLISLFPELEPFQTTTTRPPRPGESKYHFVSPNEFDRLIESGSFLEWEETHGHRYGTQRNQIQAILEARKYPVPISAVDYRGAQSYQRAFPGTLVIFLTFASLTDLPQRLRRTRPEMSDRDIATRLATATQEMTAVSDFDHVVVNREGKLDETIEAVAAIIEHELGLQRKDSS